MEIVVTVEGVDALMAKLENPELIGEPLRKFFNVVTFDLQRNVQELTPVDTGRLRASITQRVDASPVPLWGEVYTNVEYAEFVEMGSRPHWTSWTNLNEWAYRHNRNVYAVQAAIARRGTRAWHMFTNSAAYIQSELPMYVDQMARDVEKEFAK